MMRTPTIWVLLVLVAIPCSALNEEFMIGVSTDRRVYQLGDDVEVTATVTNATAEEQYIKYSGNGCTSYGIWIENSRGEIVARDHRVCVYNYVDGEDFDPFESHPLQTNPWPQNSGDYGANHPPPYSEHVDPGSYRAVVEYHLKERVYSEPFVICVGECLEPRSVVIPAAGNNPGLNGTSWSTELVFQGLGGGDSDVAITMFEHGSVGAHAHPVDVVVPDLGSLHIPNVLENLFGHQGQAALFLEIRGGDLHVSSRTTNTSDTGTFAQTVPEVSADSARPAILVPGLRHAEGVWRTNLGIINLLPVEYDVEVVLDTGAGWTVSIGPITLGPHEYVQLNDVFRGHVDPGQEFLTASARITRSRPTRWAGFLAYGSVIDNRTGDAVFVPAEPARENFLD